MTDEKVLKKLRKYVDQRRICTNPEPTDEQLVAGEFCTQTLEHIDEYARTIESRTEVVNELRIDFMYMAVNYAENAENAYGFEEIEFKTVAGLCESFMYLIDSLRSESDEHEREREREEERLPF